MTKASVCTIGDEILIGQIVDTNSSHIARELNTCGIEVTRMISIGDDKDVIISRLDEELSVNHVVIVTGGLGPTKDDITKDALATLFHSETYVENAEQAEIVRGILKSRGIAMLESNVRQAFVPEGCEVILNRLGTAPIMAFHFPEKRYGHQASLYSMPGVPYEALAALPSVIEDIKRRFRLESITHKTIMTYGLAESALAEKISEWEERIGKDGIHLAYLPDTLRGVRLRLSKSGGDAACNENLLRDALVPLREILGGIIYSESDDTLQNLLGSLLRNSGKTLSCAESCTGGMIAHLITTVPGSSEYFKGSVTSYSPIVKQSLLGVRAETIENEGIVSSAVAGEMAEGVRKVMNTTYSVATTGWADAYGDEHEPAGTVWVGVSGPEGTETARFEYHSDRCRNIERFSVSALDFLRRYIVK